MVSALDSGSRGLASTPGQVNVLCSWAKHFFFSLHPGVEILGKPDKLVGGGVGGDLVMDYHPIQL